uniref:Small ribosomal subunit protein eS24 n=1 Tax=Strongyloides stercoralis TaxID=6248 RepID=A0A0K0EE30_STRER
MVYIWVHSLKMVISTSGAVVISTKKIVNNRLMNRRQMIVDILHPLKATISKKELQEKLAALYKTTPDVVIPYGIKSQIGGGKSSGFAKIYDSLDDAKRYEHKYMIARLTGVKLEKSGRKQRKERKNRQKKFRGTAKVKGAVAKK